MNPYNRSITRVLERMRQLYLRPITQRNPDNYFEPLDMHTVIVELNRLGILVRPYQADWQSFQAYRQQYHGRFGRWNSSMEKQFEYFLSEELLEFTPDDQVMDVGSWFSPYPDLIHGKYNCRVYAQDLAYPEGIHDKKIGGSAADLPLPDSCITKIALHCTFEHFEGDADSGFISEICRVLKPGGRAVIVPLYIHQQYTIWTDPSLFASSQIVVDDGASLYRKVGWNNQFGRHYNPQALFMRVATYAQGVSFQVLHITNEQELDPACYVRFIGLFEKPV